MAEVSGNSRITLPLRENPLRERRVLIRRYGQYSVAGVLLVAMAYHIFIVETDWARMGGLRDVLSTTAEFLPNMAFFPIILEPLLETLLIAFWGTALATVVAMPVTVGRPPRTPSRRGRLCHHRRWSAGPVSLSMADRRLGSGA